MTWDKRRPSKPFKDRDPSFKYLPKNLQDAYTFLTDKQILELILDGEEGMTFVLFFAGLLCEKKLKNIPLSDSEKKLWKLWVSLLDRATL